ncbi:MAG TPA: hypothetical protein VGC85_08305 [Chthoniobacterales bacterium]
MTKTLKWWIAIAFVVVFLAGGALGLFAGALHARHIVFQHRGPHAGERMQERLERELHLTPEQSAKIAPIVQSTAAELDSIRQETSARVAETMKQSHEEILPLLTPEQRERLEAMRRRHEEAMRRREMHGPAGR